MGHFGVLGLVIVLALVLLMFGPKRLPALGRSLGDAIRGFKHAFHGGERDGARKPPSSRDIHS